MAITTLENRSLSEQLRLAREEMASMRVEVTSIATEMQRLMEMEMELARAEMQEARGHAMKGSMFGAITAWLGIITSIFLFLAIMFAIETVLPLWAAALITMGIAAVLAALFGLMAKKEFDAFSPLPKRAIRNVKEDIQWARSQMKSNVT